MKKVLINNKHKKFLYNLIHYYVNHSLSSKFFLKAYYDYFTFEKPSDDGIEGDEREFFADLYYYDIEYTIESPSELDRLDSYIDYGDFRNRLINRMKQFEFVLDEHTKGYFSESM